MTESNRLEDARVFADVRDEEARALISRYYAAFNQRQFADAAACVAADAVLDQWPFLQQECGGIGYLQFVSAWMRAFPDAVFGIRSVTPRDANVLEVLLEATGTHQGPVDIGGWVFQPTGSQVTFGLREVMELRAGKIAFSSVVYDLHDIVEKLTQVDTTNLLNHLDRLRHLADTLRTALPQSARAREIMSDIGAELDAARHAVRPYYKRTPSRWSLAPTDTSRTGVR
jgi:hypothetical protein